MKDKIRCETCKRLWQVDSEQAISIEMFDECIVCKFTPLGEGLNDGTKEQFDKITSEHNKRANTINELQAHNRRLKALERGVIDNLSRLDLLKDELKTLTDDIENSGYDDNKKED